MATEHEPQGWWHTLPGILTAIAAVVTAVGGLLVALKQVGFFEPRVLGGQSPIHAQTETSAPVALPSPSTQTGRVRVPELRELSLAVATDRIRNEPCLSG